MQPSIDARKAAMQALEWHIGSYLTSWPAHPHVFFGMGVDVVLDALKQAGYELTERK